MFHKDFRHNIQLAHDGLYAVPHLMCLCPQGKAVEMWRVQVHVLLQQDMSGKGSSNIQAQISINIEERGLAVSQDRVCQH